ncbi:TetR family transcriptional regulator [Nocardia panacis]|uniref:TetR family transcriptional regulator n=1 Tax=Nocardia panacis TaxID=2340916 RepID=UPI00193A0579|nr:TetR family transcriptional regulator [Nocardia panacis]
MVGSKFERARTPEAKRSRENAILAAAARLATRDGVREVTLTAIADEIGMHKSALLRYFETREQIYLQLAATGYEEWSTDARNRLAAFSARPVDADPSRAIATVLARTLIERPLFCDLLAHIPLNLERNVSLDAVRAFKIRAIADTAAVAAAISVIAPLRQDQALNVVVTATVMAGALWQMAAPGTHLRDFYESDPDLAHAVVDVEPRIVDIVSALLDGYANERSPAG